MEHIVSLRLFCNMAKRKRLKFYVTFIDFSQPYDRVPRHILFRVLQRLRCGAVMLAALGAAYTHTESVFGTAVILLTMGVRQGSPTSCLLFIIFVDDLIRIIKARCGLDGFLQWLPVLKLMDDTVLMATCRESMLRKLALLQNYCEEYGMQVNQSKTRFCVVCGSREDSEALVAGELRVERCDSYVYLGFIFTSDGSVSSAVKAHANAKIPHVLKFVSFINKNNDVPSFVKKRVFDAALLSSLIYGCESWVGADLRPMNKLYNWCLKKLLGVRKSTCNDVCYVESGYPSFQELVKNKQHNFFRTMWQERSGRRDDTLAFVMNLVQQSETRTGIIVRDFIREDVKPLTELMLSTADELRRSDTSRRVTYRSINPEMSVHYVYRERHTINETHRRSFTQFRVSGHSLECETGRWNRRGRGRLSQDKRLCRCGSIQTEQHVIEVCSFTQRIKDCYHFNTMQEIFSNTFF